MQQNNSYRTFRTPYGSTKGDNSTWENSASTNGIYGVDFTGF